MNAIVVASVLIAMNLTYVRNYWLEKDRYLRASKRLSIAGISFIVCAFAMLTIVFVLLSYPFLSLPIQLTLIFVHNGVASLLKLVWKRITPRRYVCLVIFVSEYFAELNLAYLLPFFAGTFCRIA